VAGSDQSDIMKNLGSMEYQGILIRLVSLVVNSIILGIISVALVIVMYSVCFLGTFTDDTLDFQYYLLSYPHRLLHLS
jgi:hypothetical protein